MAVEILEKIVLAGNLNSFLSCKNTPLTMTIRITNICAAASSCNLGCMRRQPRLHEKKEFNLFHLAILVFNLLLDSKVGKKIEIKKQKCVFMLNKVLKLVNV